MGGSILAAIINGVLQMAYKALTAAMEKRGLIRQGQAQQAAKETEEAFKTQERINDAIVDAPRTPTEAMDRLRNGTA